MPAYDYKCSKCKSVQEEIHSSKLITNDESDIKFAFQCNSCKEIGMMNRIIFGSYVATYDIASLEQKREMLKKRSKDHFKKNIVESFHVKNRRSYMP